MNMTAGLAGVSSLPHFHLYLKVTWDSQRTRMQILWTWLDFCYHNEVFDEGCFIMKRRWFCVTVLEIQHPNHAPQALVKAALHHITWNKHACLSRSRWNLSPPKVIRNQFIGDIQTWQALILPSPPLNLLNTKPAKTQEQSHSPRQQGTRTLSLLLEGHIQFTTGVNIRRALLMFKNQLAQTRLCPSHLRACSWPLRATTRKML